MASVLLLLSYLLIQIVASATKPLSSGFSVSDAQRYLRRYGYLDPIASPRSLSLSDNENDITNAIKKFQQFARLPVTGKLNEITKAKMMVPRCGVPDFRVKRSTREDGPIWPKNHLKWKITMPSAKLPKVDQRRTMEEAFEVWRKVTPLTFEEVLNGTDFMIRFFSMDGPKYKVGYAGMSGSGSVNFDDDESWYTVPKTNDGDINLMTVALHEIGHAIGLYEHSNVEGSIMTPDYSYHMDQTTLGDDDIKRIKKLYGVTEVQPKAVVTGATEQLTTTAPEDPSTFQSF